MHPPPRITRNASQLHNAKRLLMNAPQYKGRLYFLLTPQPNTFRLTQVNKLDCNQQVINKLCDTETGLNLTENAQKLTKSLYSNINESSHQAIPCVPIALPYPGSAVVLPEHQGTIRNHEALISGSFSLLRFVPVPPVRERSNKRSDSLRQLKRHNGRNKRNEGKVGRMEIAEGKSGSFIELQNVNLYYRETASCLAETRRGKKVYQQPPHMAKNFFFLLAFYFLLLNYKAWQRII